MRPQVLVPLGALANEVPAHYCQRVRYRGSAVRHADTHHGDHGIVEGAPRVLGRGHLDGHATEAPDVAAAAGAGLVHDLGRHPRDGSSQCAGQGVGGALRAAEVGKLDLAIEPDENIRALHVPVHDNGRARVEVLEALQKLAHVVGHEALVQGAELRQHLRHRAAGHILEVDVEGAFDLIVAVVRYDVWVRELLVNADFVLQVFLELQVRGTFSVDSDLFDSKKLSRPLVQSLVDGAQRARTKHLSLDPREAGALDCTRRAHGVIKHALRLCPSRGEGQAHRVVEIELFLRRWANRDGQDAARALGTTQFGRCRGTEASYIRMG
mmetsp:Transcript_33226/g.84585  ORF Transcript_33226/g.84585 Transcript_33226/m.84585 type:complete len:324 (+) Transcript_33226:222-1193(+)